MSWTEIVDIAKGIAAVLGCFTVVFAFIIGLVKPINKKVKTWIQKASKTEEQQCQLDILCAKLDKYIESNEDFKKALMLDMSVQKDFSRDTCRNDIKDTFYKYCETKKIPLYELKTAKDTFSTYSEKLKGNHYIALLFHEMEKWEVDYTHSFKEDDE